MQLVGYYWIVITVCVRFFHFLFWRVDPSPAEDHAAD